MSDLSLILEATLHGQAARRAELDELLAELASASREEPGCRAFRVLGGEEPGDLVVLSSYKDEAALRAHYATPHYLRYRARVGQLLGRPSDVVVYRVSSVVRLQDPDPPDPELFG
ncbi:MAG TPA: putative quinol monooxygenase [Conexibacter sp.]|jgi:quinol monooxygenase YgiN